MNFIKSYAAGVGAFLAIAGIASSVLIFFGYNLRILMWIDTWGPAAGWAIRIGLIVVGAIIFVLGKFGPLAPEK